MFIVGSAFLLGKPDSIWNAKINEIGKKPYETDLEELNIQNSKQELSQLRSHTSQFTTLLPKPVEIEKNSKQAGKTIDDYIERLYTYVKKWKESLDSGKNYLKTYYDLLDDTHDLVIQEQQVFLHNVTVRPVPLSILLNCSNPEYSKFLASGSLRSKPENVIDFIIVAYELSIIEIRLFELYDVVDDFVIFETNMTFKRIRKPFFFLNNLMRFQRFLDKITLITPFNVTTFNSDGTVKKKIDVVIDDIPAEYRYRKTTNTLSDDFFKTNFSIEVGLRTMPFDLFTKYVRKIDPESILIQGDVDEIPSGSVMNHFKHCQVKDELYPFSAWSNFYIFGFKYLFSSDWHASTDMFSNLRPNIYRMKSIEKSHNFEHPFRDQGFVLSRSSGAHLNRFLTTFTLLLYKDFSQSDGPGMSNFNLNIIKNGTKDALREIQKSFQMGTVNQNWKHRLVKVDIRRDASAKSLFVPWIVQSNQIVYEDFL